MWFNQYPYVNVNDLNLDYLLRAVRELHYQLENFININTIKYANPIQWNITTQYEANTVVIDGNDGTAYLSVKPVPSGVAITNTDYWTPIFTLNLIAINQNLTLRDDGSNPLSTFSSVAGDWLIWGGVLYRVTQTINTNEAYVIGYNIERFTVELFIKDYINGVITIIGDLNDLTTTDKTSIVNAINEVVSDIATIISIIGDLNNLTTTDKTSVVNAINEVNAANSNLKIYNVIDYGAVGDGVTDDTAAFTAAMADVNTTGGVLWIPQGSYVLNAPITITHHGVHIMGASKNSTYLFIDSDVNAIECIGGAGANISSPYVENLSIENRTGASTKSAIYFEYTSNCLIDKVITNHFAIGVNLSHSGNGKVTNVFTVSDISGAIGYMHRNRSVSTVYYNISCTFTDAAASTGFGFLANEGNVADINVNYFDCANGAYGMVFDGTNAPAGTSLSDINLYNIVCDGQRSAGLRIANGTDISSVNVVGGWFNESTGMSPAALCISMANVENVNISNCNCQQIASGAPTVRGIVANTVKNCNFVDNVFINCICAINCTNGSDNIIANNNVKIYGTTTVSDICIMLYDGIITGNNISGYYNYGIIGRGADCIITNNRVKNCTNAITNSATVNAITDNNIQ